MDHNQIMSTPEKASERAVSFRFLKEFVQTVPPDYTTADVVRKIVMPATLEKEVR